MRDEEALDGDPVDAARVVEVLVQVESGDRAGARRGVDATASTLRRAGHLVGLGAAMDRLGDVQMAASLLRRAEAVAGEDPAERVCMAAWALRAGRQGWAVAWLDDATPRSDEPWVLVMAAGLYLTVGDLDAARRCAARVEALTGAEPDG